PVRRPHHPPRATSPPDSRCARARLCAREERAAQTRARAAASGRHRGARPDVRARRGAHGAARLRPEREGLRAALRRGRARHRAGRRAADGHRGPERRGRRRRAATAAVTLAPPIRGRRRRRVRAVLLVRLSASRWRNRSGGAVVYPSSCLPTSCNYCIFMHSIALNRMLFSVMLPVMPGCKVGYISR
ncbi:hypothetical protein T492DRAFT_35555, partial [Pavlovales sp. CCMP2436]